MYFLSFPLHLFIVPLVIFLLALTSHSPLPCFLIFPSLHFFPSSLSYFSIPLLPLQLSTVWNWVGPTWTGTVWTRSTSTAMPPPPRSPALSPRNWASPKVRGHWLPTLLLNPSSPSPPQYQVKWRWRGGSGMSSQSPLTHKPTTAGNLLKAVPASQQADNPICLLCRAGVLKVRVL